jgi:MoxR-like ATPase
MNFKDFSELIGRINQDLGVSFCQNFQYKRKSLAGLGRAASLNQLFGNIKDHWAINEGGGTELQYHININREVNKIQYGLGFNMQYVPFANQQSPVEYVLPFIKAYFSIENELKADLADYSYDRDALLNPKYGDFVLMGKSITITQSENFFTVLDDDYSQLLSDLKALYPVYVQIFEKKNSMENFKSQLDSKVETLKNLLFKKHQIILQGAPGTGKTYTAKEIAYSLVSGENLSSESNERKRQLAELEKSEQFKFIQFHPAYSYEDFVRGIVAESNGNQIDYKTKDKILAEFAKTAFKNYQDSQKTPEILSEEKRLQLLFDEFKDFVQTAIEGTESRYKINDIAYIFEIENDAFRYKGDNWGNSQRMKFQDILSLHSANVTERWQIKVLEGISGLAKQHATYFLLMLKIFQEFIKDKKPSIAIEGQIQLKNYVLIIDEINRANLPSVLGELIYALEYRGESVDSMYDLDGDRSLVLPENLYIIGTMNTADRSVGHIDYAIRRRFAFVDVGADENVITLEKAKTLFNEVRNIFKADIASDFELKDIELGHSYYLAKDESELPVKLEYEIKPLLREYVKDGILLSEAKDKIEKLNV